MVVINRGEKELQTVRQFEEYFNTKVEPDEGYNTIEYDACLCQIDVDKELKKIGVEYKYDCIDYYVGQLDQVDENWLNKHT